MPKEINKILKDWKKYDKKKHDKEKYDKEKYKKSKKHIKINRVKPNESLHTSKRIKHNKAMFENNKLLESYLRFTEEKKPYEKLKQKIKECKASVSDLYLGWARCNNKNLLIWFLCLIFLCIICYFIYTKFIQKPVT